ncbi:type II secretion system F family protein [Pasteuria penetrans]|uniref:type II secretion system F family protein n=1 Tax=Pasteuria penetrans TaxID=86005 RepID=UPI000FB711BF|nr:type II secretion system F family protein [Pasteuria penetrans]
MARLSAEDCARLSTCLEQLLSSGLPLLTALELLVEQQILPASLGRYTCRKIAQGVPLAEVWRQGGLPKMMVAWLRASEEQGDYTAGLRQSVLFYHAQSRFIRHFRQACRYPCLVLVMTAVVFLFLLITLVPKFSELYTLLHMDPPVSIHLIIYFLVVLQGFCWFLPLSLYVGWQFLRRGYGWGWILRIPGLRLGLRTFATHFVAQQLSASLRAGIPLLRGLELAASTAPWPQLGDSLRDVRTRVQCGVPLAVAWEGESTFLRALACLTALGEAGGCCEVLWDHLTVSTEKAFQQQMKRLLSWLEPLLLGVVGIGVAALVLLWLLPLLALMEAI